jgi:hypothetical protein
LVAGIAGNLLGDALDCLLHVCHLTKSPLFHERLLVNPLHIRLDQVDTL